MKPTTMEMGWNRLPFFHMRDKFPVYSYSRIPVTKGWSKFQDRSRIFSGTLIRRKWRQLEKKVPDLELFSSRSGTFFSDQNFFLISFLPNNSASCKTSISHGGVRHLGREKNIILLLTIRRTTLKLRFLRELDNAIATVLVLEYSGGRQSAEELFKSPKLRRLLKWYLEVESKRYLAPRLHRARPINKFNINLNQVPVACEQKIPGLTMLSSWTHIRWHEWLSCPCRRNQAPPYFPGEKV
jgi:hypothetical protein